MINSQHLTVILTQAKYTYIVVIICWNYLLINYLQQPQTKTELATFAPHLCHWQAYVEMTGKDHKILI